MNLVDRRIKIRYGPAYGVSVTCAPEQWTRVAVRLPLEMEAAAC
jgi:two-component system LytT family sensor kinase